MTDPPPVLLGAPPPPDNQLRTIAAHGGLATNGPGVQLTVNGAITGVFPPAMAITAALAIIGAAESATLIQALHTVLRDELGDDFSDERFDALMARVVEFHRTGPPTLTPTPAAPVPDE